jgi:NAD-dependent dihydropyrimidine dehydrogenase PreA subunit
MATSPGWRELLFEHWHLARTLRRVQIVFSAERCIGLWECYEVCPVDCWAPERESGVVRFVGLDRCIACNACVLQCSAGAIELRVPNGKNA